MQLIFANDLIDLKRSEPMTYNQKSYFGVTELQNVGGIPKNSFFSSYPRVILLLQHTFISITI